MPARYIIHASLAPSRYPPINRVKVFREDTCIRCGKCAKICIYGVHRRWEPDPRIMEEPLSHLCKNCFVCAQNCPGGNIHFGINPEFASLGNAFFSSDQMTGIMRQAEEGKTPVSGAGYGGAFAGEGFEGFWTDMSEIVRPTRDGIHGRESINTSITIGSKTADVNYLFFDEEGNPLSSIPANLQVNLPVLFDCLPDSMRHPYVIRCVVEAATQLGTLALVPSEHRPEGLDFFENHIVEIFSAENMAWKDLVRIATSRSSIEILDFPALSGLPEAVKKVNPDLVLFVRIGSEEMVEKRVAELLNEGVDVAHLDIHGPQLPGVLRRVHDHLVDLSMRDLRTVIASGAIAEASHVPKAMILGADAVAIDLPLLIAQECVLCRTCTLDESCPRGIFSTDPSWAAQRIVNLMAAWHNQLLEILGAMGMREAERLRGERGRAIFRDELERDLL